jgi:hypothetical protein
LLPKWLIQLTSSQEGLDNRPDGLKIPAIHEPCAANGRRGQNMNSIQNLPYLESTPRKDSMEKICRHPRVRVVARDDDAEFVECQECGDVFEASEFKDMAIEENFKPDEA